MITMRNSTFFLICSLILLVLFVFSGIDSFVKQGQAEKRISRTVKLVQQLGLTDLALFTEARYTRHPSQADFHSAFQDHPLAIEHFPSGSLVPPPRHLARPWEMTAKDPK